MAPSNSTISRSAESPARPKEIRPGGGGASFHENFEGIQGLRFVAAFMVVVGHSTFYSHERLQASMPVLWGLGLSGVAIFFVISGFVMVVSTRSLVDRAHAGRIFFLRRLIRIVPMYWLATSIKLVTLLLVPAVVLHSRFSVGHVVSSYLFIPTVNVDGEWKPLLAVGWTLYFEMFFYALFAVGLALKANLKVFMGVILGLLAFASNWREPSWPPATMFLDGMLLQFYAGMLIADFIRRVRAPGYIIPSAMMVLGLVSLILRLKIPGAPNALSSGLPAVAVVLGGAWLEPVLKGKLPAWLLLLGDASYVLYLFHPLVVPGVPLVLAKLGIQNFALSVFASISAGLATGVLMHIYVEQPVTQKVKELILPRRRETAVVRGSVS